MENNNIYKNKFGFHTPKKTEETFNVLKERFATLKWQDGSWHNDTCDTIYLELQNDIILNIYIPNSNKNDPSNEEFNTFSLIVDEDEIMTSSTLDEILNYISKMNLEK